MKRLLSFFAFKRLDGMISISACSFACSWDLGHFLLDISFPSKVSSSSIAIARFIAIARLQLLDLL